jgi:redox-sensitive bicupin YhaK (pirin superfamily)
MSIQVYPSDSRGTADHGWLKTRFSFSFSEYYNPRRMHFGALRVFNDDFIAGGGGFGKHPHENMEIITLVFSGALEHKDSMGNTGVIGPDEVQVMSAGTGIMHSEYNHSKHEAVSLFQIWIIPNRRGHTPRYDQAQFDSATFRNAVTPLVTPYSDDNAGLWIHQNAVISTGIFDDGFSTTLQLTSKHGLFCMVAEGNAVIAGQSLSRRDAIEITDVEQVTVVSGSADTRLVFIEVPL